MAIFSLQRLSRSPVATFELLLSEHARNVIVESRKPDPDANQTLYSQSMDASLGN